MKIANARSLSALGSSIDSAQTPIKSIMSHKKYLDKQHKLNVLNSGLR